jgi:anti-sigma factor RsiW
MSTPYEPLTAAQAESLVATSEPWLSCDECFDQIDTYVDALIRDGRRLDEPLRVHLARCPACLEEGESLISLAAAEHGISPEQMLDAFRTDLGLPSDTRAEPERKSTIARLVPRYRDVDR